MAPREFRHALDDMLEAIECIQSAVAGKTFAEYESQWLLRHGVERGIEVISGASRAIPEEIRPLRPDVPWQKVRGIGNVLRHEYHGFSNAIMWRVVTDEIPPLREAIESIVSSLPE